MGEQAEDCLPPPSSALKLRYRVFFHLFISVLVGAVLSMLPPLINVHSNNSTPEKSPYPVPLNDAQVDRILPIDFAHSFSD